MESLMANCAADYVRSKLATNLKFYSAVPDAGFFLDHANTKGMHQFGLEMRATFTLANTTGSLNVKRVMQRGLLEDGVDPMDCIFPQNFAQIIQTSMHVTHSQ